MRSLEGRGRVAVPRGAGFSLMEVVVAMTIMLILLPLATPVYESFMKDLTEQSLRERLHEFRRALRIFYQDHKRYPYLIQDHFGNNVSLLEDDRSELVQGVHEGERSYPANPRRYLESIPIDPFSDRKDWQLVPAAPRPAIATSQTPLPTTSSTRQLSAASRAITSGAVRIVDNIVPVEQIQVYDIRSRSPGYEDW